MWRGDYRRRLDTVVSVADIIEIASYDEYGLPNFDPIFDDQ